MSQRSDRHRDPWTTAGVRRGFGPGGSETGISLIEVVVATVIATLAVLGLAYSFGTGRALIDRFAIARAALGVAQGRLETLAGTSLSDTALAFGTHGTAFVLDDQVLGQERWIVSLDSNQMRRVTAEVIWGQGSRIDTMRVTRLFSAF
ncbi:MAG: hypothetical protein A2W00_05400 [Candidatus Eisenbacteria bacterium RBG_16_71_46]|nr:MAG: hypothetical protein A2W00_05400 [Candidatus Eisenbacteria bacterium RBG_16_71_46]OGF23985.1 MAG: hypothetical protein A2V63_03875 [Candidatus Eisenbacteria bacterium RBG_19FT_COMBO_70_11]